MGGARVKRIGGKNYKLYKSGATYGQFGIGDAEEIARKLRGKGFSVRIERNIWGNTYIWIRKKSSSRR